MLPISDIDLPPGWEAAGAAVLAADGVVLVLGGPDCGKSTFCRYVLGRAQAAGKPIAFIDGDLGQSHLGPPATLGLNFYPPHAPDDSGLFPDALYFIGQTSPPGKMLELVVGLRRLAESARTRGCRRIIVNTSGFIGGPPALRLKLAKVETLEPRLILGLQTAGGIGAHSGAPAAVWPGGAYPAGFQPGPTQTLPPKASVPPGTVCRLFCGCLSPGSCHWTRWSGWGSPSARDRLCLKIKSSGLTSSWQPRCCMLKKPPESPSV